MAGEDGCAAVIGGGVIGASWAALFLAGGLSVRVYDMDPDAERKVRSYVADAWRALDELGATSRGDPERITFHADVEEAVEGAPFVQESVPERIDAKLELYGRIEGRLADGAVVATSSSGLLLSELQRGWTDPSRLVLGHPFNPPHLIPLVELYGNDRTSPAALAWAEAFYQRIGKVTIRLRREVPAHVANRLQAALWREALHLVQTGVASAADVDKAVWAGPGLRWAAMGPHMLFHLAAGEGGMEEFCSRYRDSFARWWDDLGDADLDGEAAAELAAGVGEEAEGRGIAELASERDRLIVAMLKSMRPLRRS